MSYRKEITIEYINTVRVLCQMIAQSPLLNTDARTHEQRLADAFFVIMSGNDLGFTPMQSLQMLYIVKGKVMVSANGMRALMALAGFRIDTPDPVTVTDSATVRVSRNGVEWHTSTYTLDMARKAGLVGKDNWSKYTAEMLIARATAHVARYAAADVIGGLYTPEEIIESQELDIQLPPPHMQAQLPPPDETVPPTARGYDRTKWAAMEQEYANMQWGNDAIAALCVDFGGNKPLPHEQLKRMLGVETRDEWAAQHPQDTALAALHRMFERTGDGENA